MNMGAAIGAFKYTGYQYIGDIEGCIADRALSRQIAVNAVYAAANMHEAVIAAGYGGKGQCPYQVAFVQF